MKFFGKNLYNNKAQSTVEFILCFAAMLSVLIVFFSPNGVFRGAVTGTLNQAVNGITEMSTRLSESHGQGASASVSEVGSSPPFSGTVSAPPPAP